MALDDALRALHEKRLPPYSLAVTFDDGYRNFYTDAYPILRSLEIPATMFIATDFVFKKKPLWVDRLEYALGKRSVSREENIAHDTRLRDELKALPDSERERRLQEIETESGVTFGDFSGERAVYAPLLESEIQEMQQGGVTFGAHTRSHPILSNILPDRIPAEIAGSKEDVASICTNVSAVFAYPNGQRGDWNDAVEKEIVQAEFAGALTTIEGVNTAHTHPLRLRRIALDATDNGPAFALIVSGVRLYLRTLRDYFKLN